MEKTTVEMELAKTGNLEELRKWLNWTFFSPEAQVVLVERKEDALLLEYAGRYSFCKEAQIRLVELRNAKVLNAQLQRHSLCLEAQRLLVSLI